MVENYMHSESISLPSTILKLNNLENFFGQQKVSFETRTIRSLEKSVMINQSIKNFKRELFFAPKKYKRKKMSNCDKTLSEDEYLTNKNLPPQQPNIFQKNVFTSVNTKTNIMPEIQKKSSSTESYLKQNTKNKCEISDLLGEINKLNTSMTVKSTSSDDSKSQLSFLCIEETSKKAESNISVFDLIDKSCYNLIKAKSNKKLKLNVTNRRFRCKVSENIKKKYFYEGKKRMANEKFNLMTFKPDLKRDKRYRELY